MILTDIREAPLIRAYLMITQEKSKKGFKTIQSEINKMTKTFGNDFDKELHKMLINEIDFSNIKSFQNPKNAKNQFFIQEFPQLIERNDFINFFSEIYMCSNNNNSPSDIFNTLKTLNKLSIENQIKILISLVMSNKNENDSIPLLIDKLKEFKNEGKININESIKQTLLIILGTIDDEKFKDDVENIVNFLEDDSNDINLKVDDIKQVSDIEKLLDTGNEEPIEIEKIFYEIGPFFINNMINASDCRLLNFSLNEKRLAIFILFLTNHQNWIEDKENKQLNKIFLNTLNNEGIKKINENDDDINQSNQNVSWNIDNLYKMFKKSIDNMDNNQIINGFDDPKFNIKDKKNFDFFISTLQKLKILTNPSQFFNFIFTKWNNELNQIEFLNFLINNPLQGENSIYSLKNYQGNKVRKDVELSNKLSLSKSGFLIENWSNIDLIELLLKLSKGNYYIKVKEIFDWPIQNIPEILMLALISITPEPDEFLYDELIQEVIAPFLLNHNSSQSLIDEIWNTNKDIIIKVICTMWESQPDLMNLSRILDISQKLKESLLLLVNCSNYNFSVNLAILSVKRDFLHIEKWIKERIKKSGDEFIEALINYLQNNLLAHCKGNNTNKGNVLEKAQLSMESLAIIIENLLSVSTSPTTSIKIKNEIKNIYKSIFENFDELQVQPINSEEIEKATNNLLQQIFNGEMTVSQLVKKLIEYQKSSNPKETEIYACLTHSILDEYRFYHQYPEKHLKIAAELFGQLINNKLVEGVVETIALKYILESIKKGSGPLFTFGIIALNQFINRIYCWGNYLNTLLDMPIIKENSELYDNLINVYNENAKKNGLPLKVNEEALKKQKEKENEINNIDGNINKSRIRKLSKESSLFNSFGQFLSDCNSDENIQIPSQEIMTTIKNIFNSLNKNNIMEKSKELKEVLNNENLIRWFSNYLIYNRIISDNNNHGIYNEMINQIESNILNKMLIKDTILSIKKILIRGNLDDGVKEKLEIKNLGSWLGLITIGKNKPILAKDLDLRELIIDAYKNGKLYLIIVLVVKILEHTYKNKIFQPKNPWIQALLSLLLEIYTKPHLKQKIKEEIEKLIKYLNIDTKQIPISKKLENIQIKSSEFEKIQNEMNRELYKNISQLTDYIKTVNDIINQKKNKQTVTEQDICIFLTDVLNSAISENLNTIIEKNVNTALQATKGIIINDFMFDYDENKFKLSVVKNVKTYAGCLAMVDSKEILKSSINKNFLKYKNLEKEIIENLCNNVDNKYIEIGCVFITNQVVKIAAEKILKDEDIIKQIENKKQNKIDKQQQKELLMKMKDLPDSLKPNPQGLTEEQFKVYENFEKKFKFENDSVDNNFLNTVYQLLKEVIKSNLNKTNYEFCMFNIQLSGNNSKSNITIDDNSLLIIDKIISENKINDIDLIFDLSRISLKYAISASKNSNNLLLNIYSEIIKGWILVNNEISKKITVAFLEQNDNSVKFNYDINYMFYKKGIFDMELYFKYFNDFIINSVTKEFAKNLLNELIQIIDSTELKDNIKKILKKYKD